MTDEFKKRCTYLRKLGVKFNQDYEYRGELGKDRKSHDVQVFTGIHLPFTAHEWVALASREGGFYVGGCCGNMSALQDEVEGVFRFDGGFVGCKKLVEIVDAYRAHDESDDAKKKKPDLGARVQKYAKLLAANKAKRLLGKKLMDPWQFMDLLSDVVRDFCGQDRPQKPAIKINPELHPVDEAIHTLEWGLRALSWHRMEERQNKRDANRIVSDQDQGNALVMLARILPALKTLNENIDKLKPPPFEGVALVLKDAPDDVLTNRLGFCVFTAKEEADRVLKIWTREEDAYVGEGKDSNKLKPKAGDFLVRSVRVSPEKGIEFLG